MSETLICWKVAAAVESSHYLQKMIINMDYECPWFVLNAFDNQSRAFSWLLSFRRIYDNT